MTKEEAEKEVRSIGRTCKGPYTDVETPEAVTILLKAGKNAAAERLASMSRKGCGADFNNIIVAGALDGEEHAYKCPKCGVEGSYRAPSFGELTQA